MRYFLHSSPIPVKQVLYFFTYKVTKCVGAYVLGKVTFPGVLENMLPFTHNDPRNTLEDRKRLRETDRQTDRQTDSWDQDLLLASFEVKKVSVWPHSVLPSSFSPLIQTFLPWKSSLQAYNYFSFINRNTGSKCLESIAEENF